MSQDTVEMPPNLLPDQEEKIRRVKRSVNIFGALLTIIGILGYFYINQTVGILTGVFGLLILVMSNLEDILAKIF